MAMVRNPTLGFDTRATLIRLAFQIDLSPRICFALMLPVGLQLVRGLGLYRSVMACWHWAGCWGCPGPRCMSRCWWQ